jgi:hypothetical protein
MTQRKAKATKKEEAKKSAEKEVVDSFTIPQDTEKVVEVDIVGCAEGMLQNQLTREAKEALKGGPKTGMRKTRAQKTEEARTNWKNTGHFTKDGTRGHPSEAFLKAMQRAASMVELSCGGKRGSMKAIPSLITPLPDAFSKEGLPLTTFSANSKANFNKRVEPAEHWAINKVNKAPVPVYRTHILGGWKMTVRVSYDSSVLSVQDVLMLMQKAGSNVGIGAWRKENSGVFGRWKVVGARASR